MEAHESSPQCSLAATMKCKIKTHVQSEAFFSANWVAARNYWSFETTPDSRNIFANVKWMTHLYVLLIEVDFCYNEWMNGILGHDYALLRLYWAGDNLGKCDEYCHESCPWRRNFYVTLTILQFNLIFLR